VQKFLPLLKKGSEDNADNAGWERVAVVNVGSVLSSCDYTLTSTSTGYMMHYRASKAALNLITLSLAMQLKDTGILFVVINPGNSDTSILFVVNPGNSDTAILSVVINPGNSDTGILFVIINPGNSDTAILSVIINPGNSDTGILFVVINPGNSDTAILSVVINPGNSDTGILFVVINPGNSDTGILFVVNNPGNYSVTLCACLDGWGLAQRSHKHFIVIVIQYGYCSAMFIWNRALILSARRVALTYMQSFQESNLHLLCWL
jgi:hypothetical protein